MHELQLFPERRNQSKIIMFLKFKLPMQVFNYIPRKEKFKYDYNLGSCWCKPWATELNTDKKFHSWKFQPLLIEYKKHLWKGHDFERYKKKSNRKWNMDGDIFPSIFLDWPHNHGTVYLTIKRRTHTWTCHNYYPPSVSMFHRYAKHNKRTFTWNAKFVE